MDFDSELKRHLIGIRREMDISSTTHNIRSDLFLLTNYFVLMKDHYFS